MATKTPISTISYNTEDFLREKLDDLYQSHIIQAYMYICHKGEDGDKDHIHVRIEPNKKLDPMDILERLKQPVVGEDLPRTCRPFRPSKEEDWFLYVVHDPDYLRIKYHGGDKGEKIPYKWENIKASKDYDIETAFIRAKAAMDHTPANMMQRIKQGTRSDTLIAEGNNPFTVNAIMRAVSGTDYNRVHDMLQDAMAEISLMQDAVHSAGFDFMEDPKCKNRRLLLIKADFTEDPEDPEDIPDEFV